jgi:hypothetical protein
MKAAHSYSFGFSPNVRAPTAPPDLYLPLPVVHDNHEPRLAKVDFRINRMFSFLIQRLGSLG